MKLASEKVLRIKPEKRQFPRKSIQFLSYILENRTNRPSDDKTRVTNIFPLPQTKKASKDSWD